MVLEKNKIKTGKLGGKLNVILIMIGFLVVLLDCSVNTGISYPREYKNDANVIGAYQCYTIAHLYGAEWDKVMATTEDENNTEVYLITNVSYSGIRVDIFNDFIGFFLIMIGCLRLRSRSKAFKMTAYTCIAAIVLGGIIELLPFVMNGVRLCTIALLLFIAHVGITVSVGYFFTCAVSDVLEDVAFRGDRRVLMIAWFLMFILQVIVEFASWLMLSPTLVLVYNMVLFAVTLYYLFRVYNLSEYIVGGTLQ